MPIPASLVWASAFFLLIVAPIALGVLWRALTEEAGDLDGFAVMILIGLVTYPAIHAIGVWLRSITASIISALMHGALAVFFGWGLIEMIRAGDDSVSTYIGLGIFFVGAVMLSGMMLHWTHRLARGAAPPVAPESRIPPEPWARPEDAPDDRWTWERGVLLHDIAGMGEAARSRRGIRHLWPFLRPVVTFVCFLGMLTACLVVPAMLLSLGAMVVPDAPGVGFLIYGVLIILLTLSVVVLHVANVSRCLRRRVIPWQSGLFTLFSVLGAAIAGALLFDLYTYS